MEELQPSAPFLLPFPSLLSSIMLIPLFQGSIQSGQEPKLISLSEGVRSLGLHKRTGAREANRVSLSCHLALFSRIAHISSLHPLREEVCS
jgi:hypothetical protein